MLVTLQFGNAEAKNCCDHTQLRRRYGATAARVVARRLQQLHAMESLDDLEFLPFNSTRRGPVIEVTIDDRLTLVLESRPQQEKGRKSMHVILVRELRERADLAKSS